MKEENFEIIKQEIKELKNKNKNFQIIRKKIGEERLRDFFNIVYPKFNITEIETIPGIPDSTLGYWFKKLKIPFIRNHIYSKSIPGNVNSKIIISKDGVVYKAETIKITPELAYIIGFTLGDGSVQPYMIEVFNKDKNLREILFEYLKPYGTITEEERENGLWRLRLSSGKIANLIKNENGIRQDTIDYIFNNGELARKFIAAFWDAEGSVLKNKKWSTFNLYLYNSNNFLLDKICNFLKNQKIKYSILNLKTRKKDYFINGIKINTKKRLQRINIHMDSSFKWANLIGVNMGHSKKREIVIKIINKYGGNKNE